MLKNKQDKRIETLEEKLECLTRELQRTGALGHIGPWVFMFNDTSNECLSHQIDTHTTRINAIWAVIRALLKYLKLEYVEETGAKIRKIKKNK